MLKHPPHAMLELGVEIRKQYLDKLIEGKISRLRSMIGKEHGNIYVEDSEAV